MLGSAVLAVLETDFGGKTLVFGYPKRAVNGWTFFREHCNGLGPDFPPLARIFLGFQGRRLDLMAGWVNASSQPTRQADVALRGATENFNSACVDTLNRKRTMRLCRWFGVVS